MMTFHAEGAGGRMRFVCSPEPTPFEKASNSDELARIEGLVRSLAPRVRREFMLAVARIAGETAPLLFTSLGNDNWSTDMTQPIASLPIAIYRYAGSAYDEWVSLAWTGAMLITVGVLVLNILSRFSHAAVAGKQGG